MGLLDSNWGNLAVGLASIRNPGLLNQIANRKQAEKERQDRLKRQQMLDEQNQINFGNQQYQFHNAINDKAKQDQALKEASYLLSPESSMSPSKYATMNPTEKNQALMSQGLLSGNAGITNFAAKQMQPRTVSPGQTLLGPDNKPIFTAPNRPMQAKNPLKVLNKDGTVTWMSPQDATGQLAPVETMSLQTNPDGSTSFIKTSGKGGISNNGDITKTTRTGLEKDALNSIDVMSQVREMKANFKPEYQRIGFRYDTWQNNLGDKLKDIPFVNKFVSELDPQERKALEGFARHKADNLKLFTKTLSDLSGAAVTASEAKRAESWFPKVGTGIFDGDSSIEYKAKLKNFEDFTRNALIRQQYALENGVKWQSISIDSVPDIIEREGDKIMLKYANMPEDQARAAVKRELKIKYGNMM